VDSLVNDIQSIKAEIVEAVRIAVRSEMKREVSPLLTIPETARMFRLRDDVVRQAARDGLVKCARRTRGGEVVYMVDVEDARRIWGAS
jgi:hypothetical protein